jgi:hypothetical protein
MSDFPRGWTLTDDNGGSGATAAQVTVPAIAGVVHVLDGFTGIIANNSAAATAPEIILNSSDGTFSGFVLSRLSAQANSENSDSDSGLDLAAGPGASLTISFSTPVANVIEYLRLKGHDI